MYRTVASIVTSMLMNLNLRQGSKGPITNKVSGVPYISNSPAENAQETQDAIAERTNNMILSFFANASDMVYSGTKICISYLK